MDFDEDDDDNDGEVGFRNSKYGRNGGLISIFFLVEMESLDQREDGRLIM